MKNGAERKTDGGLVEKNTKKKQNRGEAVERGFKWLSLLYGVNARWSNEKPVELKGLAGPHQAPLMHDE